MKRINQSGQATLLAILIITTISIVTAVGVSSRQNAALKRSSYTKQTDQGFACANSAVDQALLCIKDEEAKVSPAGNPLICAATANTPIAVGDTSCVYSYSVSDYLPDSVTGILRYPSIQKDTVLQINTSGVNNIQILWNSPAFLEVSHIYLDGTEYKMDKYLLKRNGDSAPTGVSASGFNTNCNVNSFCVLSSPTFADQTNSVIRIHSYFADALDVQIKSSDSTFATVRQGLEINAKGTAGAVVRNLEVIRTNPQLPAIFDYVLYSEEGSITK